MSRHDQQLTAGSGAPRQYLRVRDLRDEYGFKKSWVFKKLGDGSLRGRKVDGLLLIERASVDELIASAEPWRPRGAK